MDSLVNDELIKSAIELLASLTSPLVKENEQQKDEILYFDDALRCKLLLVIHSDAFERLEKVYNFDKKWRMNDSKSQVRWNFVQICLHLMEIIRNTIIRAKDEKRKLLSVAQKKVLETTFQFVVSLAVLPYLLPGVGVSLEKKCKHFLSVKSEDITNFAKYRRLCFTMNVILNLNSIDVFHEIIISKHLEDVLAALFQLSFAPFKKPVHHDLDEVGSLDLESLDDNYEIDRMTYSLWMKLESNKKQFRSQLEKLQSHLYSPLLIRNYMILLRSKEIPRWMRQNLTNLLTGIVLEENGVIFTIKGIIEANNDSSTLSFHYMTVAKLISAIFCNENELKMKLLSSQLEKILSNDKRRSYDYVIVDVIALAVKEMLQNNQSRVEKYLLDAILNPLRNIEVCSEEEINEAVTKIYGLCIMPSNNTIAVPIQIILPVSSILCFVCTHIKDSVCYLKSLIKELLGRLFLEVDEDTLSCLLDAILFDEHISAEIVRVPLGKKVVLSSNGGVSIVSGHTDFSELENGMMLLQLMKEIKPNDRLISSLFVYLLKKYVSNSADKDSATKRVVVVFLLAQLSQDSETLRHILKNAENIIGFVRELLNIHSEEDDQNVDVIRICLTFLSMVLYDFRQKKDVNWHVFTLMIPALKRLKNSSVPDVMLLAVEVHNLIVTRNVIGGGASVDVGKSGSLISEIPQSVCEKTIEDACDTLLPVRAHALMELIALIKKKDVETLAKKEKIFCIFQENLKNKDSFLYLRAIEGLASLAELRTDDVLPLLCQEFILCSLAETRLKIGEILTRTVKSLNNFILPHKHLLINTFLNGVKDKDSLVRASSLSNLGEVCFVLQSNIEDVLYEIIQCAETVSESDKNVEPRRAAVFLIMFLFKGLKITVLKVLEAELLKLYRTLKRINSSDEDEVVRLQAGISLNILNEVIKDSFITKPVLEKKIHVLECPK